MKKKYIWISHVLKDLLLYNNNKSHKRLSVCYNLFSRQHIMRFQLLSILLCISMIQVYANSYAQRATIQGHNLSLEQVFSKISNQTGYDFLYNIKDIKLAEKVDLNHTNQNIVDILNACFEGQTLTYSIKNKTIVVKRRDPRAIDQRFNIKGRVVSSKSLPLVGASIQVKGSNTSVQTDKDGFFQLQVDVLGTELQISYMGYQPVTVKSKADLGVIVLHQNVLVLEDVSVVVNTGYQTISKERATGAFGTVSREQLDRPALDISQRLIGTTAGMQAKLDENGTPKFEIRGQTSLYANASPLVVVDGFAIQGSFDAINPNDVASVTVLKDAAAASIWGARAGNGVIVITTKKGSAARSLNIDFQAFTRVGNKLDLDYVNPLASSAETVEYEKMIFNKWSPFLNPGDFTNNYYKQFSLASLWMNEHYLGFLTADERDERLEKLKTLSNKKQIKEHLLSVPIDQQYNLTLQGSTEKLRNITSLLYQKSQSNFKGTGNESYMLNNRMQAQVFKWMDFNTAVMVQYKDRKTNGVSLSDIQNLSPYEMLKNEDGSLTNINKYYQPIIDRFVPTSAFPYSDWSYNPIQEIANRQLKNSTLNGRFMGALVFKPLKGLTYESSFQYEFINSNTKNRHDDGTFYVRDMVNTSSSWDQKTNKVTPNLPKGSILTQPSSKTNAWIFRNQVSFDRAYHEKHEINAIAGTEINNVVIQTNTPPPAYGYNDRTMAVGTLPNGPGGNFYPIKNWIGENQTFTYTNVFSYRTERFFSLFGNAAYTYNKKYTVSASARTDASNMITDDPSYRYAPLWSVGGSWLIGRESFMTEAKDIDLLKLRVTYGYNGNVDKSTAFMPLISLGTTPNRYIDDYTASISSFGNPSLRWEKTGTWNIGVDYSLFKGQLYGKVDIYNKYGKDLIAQLSIPAVNGTTSQKLNNAEMSNKGIELEIGTFLPIKGRDIVWRGNLNFSYNKNRITELFIANYNSYDLYEGGTSSYVQGHDANAMWTYEYAGIHDNQPMIKGENGQLYNMGAWTPGNASKYMIDAGTKVAPYTLGFVNSFKIYDFDFSFILTGKFGHKLKKNSFNYPVFGSGRVLPNNQLSYILDADPNTVVPMPLNDVEDRFYFWSRFHPYMSYLASNASHLRMQEISLSYRVPTQKLSLLNKSRITAFVQGNDVFTVLFNDGKEDPEYPLGGLKPQPKFTLGLKASF